MKTRFNSYDIICGVTELQKLIGQRLNQIYDIDNKTYLFRFQGNEEEKSILLIESGIRFHTTAFEWQKNMSPSGFCMKLRKHLKNKRLEKLHQLGNDRIVDFQFGVADAAYHVILELYDRGNIILCDSQYMTLYILRPHTQNEVTRFAVREVYPKGNAKQTDEQLSENKLLEYMSSSKEQNLRRFLLPILDCGPALIDHVLKQHNLENRTIPKIQEESVVQDEKTKDKKTKRNRSDNLNQTPLKCFDFDKDMHSLIESIKEINELLMKGRQTVSKGYIIQTIEEKPTFNESNQNHFRRNVEFHPFLFAQFGDKPFVEYKSFMVAADEFFSSLEAQKIDIKTIQQERDALKKLSNVKEDHLKRLKDLNAAQETDIKKAELITCNQELVDNAILAVQSAIASQLPWSDINELVKEAQSKGDPVASCIKQLKLEVNHISLFLKNIYNDEEDESDQMIVDIDLSLSAWANARRYYDQKRSAAHKEQKTIDASQKALKSAEKKTQQTLKDVRTISTISKARKVYWFEKFFWFLSSENYLVVGGRDAQQNELIVKRYMRTSDVYVHAEIQGASSVIIRNPSGGKIPPKTLLEAGTMAISYSVAWDAKVVTNVYCVQSDQVSKTAPSGEYLPTGSFMIRGKKNFLPPCNLIMGLSLLFKLEDSFVANHIGERKVREIDDEVVDCDSQLLDLNIKDACLYDNNTKNHTIESKSKVENQLASLDPLRALKNDRKVDFPDTQVNVDHCTGKISIMSDSPNDSNSKNVLCTDLFSSSNASLLNSEDCTIISAAPSRTKQQPNSKKRKDSKIRKTEGEVKTEFIDASKDDNVKQTQIKRGQKGKLKKIKIKYRNQDEEERELRMMILNSSGKDNATQTNSKVSAQLANENEIKNPIVQKSLTQNKTTTDAEETEDVPVGADEEIINTLTGQPFDGDELLFAIPVVAPYQSLQHYKFKVKLTPGTGKRGRAAKMALSLFLKDKSCNAREKDLLKSVKDEAMARNIPGKVKLSAPQMQKLKNS